MIDIYFEAPDGDGEPTLWHSVGPGDEPMPLLRRRDLRAAMPDYHWDKLVAAMEAL